MTIVLLAVPLVTMTVLYGSVIKTLKVGIRLEISAVDSVDQESKWFAVRLRTIREEYGIADSTDDSTVVKQKMSFFQKITAKLRKDKKASALKARSANVLIGAHDFWTPHRIRASNELILRSSLELPGICYQ